MSSFRNINYGRLLYETLRNYFSVNSSGDMSIIYHFLAAIIAVLQHPFDAYAVYRTKEELIAECKWQIGQLTNVLNYLYDSTLKRIFITQSVLRVVVDPMFQYAPSNFDTVFAEAPTIFERTFADKAASTLVTINIPAGINESDLVATVEQIRAQGIPYKIKVF
jgi:hypothetical protein